MANTILVLGICAATVVVVLFLGSRWLIRIVGKDYPRGVSAPFPASVSGTAASPPVRKEKKGISFNKISSDTVLGIIGAIGCVWIFSGAVKGCAAIRQDIHNREVADEIRKANPDNHEWRGAFAHGGRVFGASLSTDNNTRAFTLKWHDTMEGSCTVICHGVPGGDGNWVGEDTKEVMGGAFNVTFKDDKTIIGSFQNWDSRKGKGEMVPFKFVRVD